MMHAERCNTRRPAQARPLLRAFGRFSRSRRPLFPGKPCARAAGPEGSRARRPPPAPRESAGRLPAPAGEQRYYATCHPGLEEVVAAELRSPRIGAARVRPGRAGVSFVGDAAVGYRANLWLRSAIRVLQLLAEAELDPRQPGGDEVRRLGL